MKKEEIRVRAEQTQLTRSLEKERQRAPESEIRVFNNWVGTLKTDYQVELEPHFEIQVRLYFSCYTSDMGPDYSVSNARGLGKKQLGGVIFGANKTTIDECLSKQLFGLPGSHFRYVKKIKPNLPLFLFNYTGRTLHGIFEAASSGQMNIDPFAWISEGSQRTQYPAQVQIRVKLHYEGLTENQFKPIIADNYYTSRHFWFELDHAQTKKLSFLLSNQALADPRATLTPTIKPFEREHLRNIPVETVGTRLNGSKSFPSNLKDIKTYTTLAPRIRPLEKESVCHMPPEFVGGHLNSAKSFPSGIKDITTCKTVNEKELITTRLKDLAQKRNLVASGPPPSDCKDESDVVMNNTTVEKKEDICYRVIAQLFEKVKELMACKSAQSDKIIYLERKIASMEQNLVQIRVKLHYEGLTENQFKPIIADNYYTSRHFWFELDHAQTKKLSFLLSNQALADPRATLTPTIKPFEREHLRNIPVETVGTRLNGSKSFPSNLKDIKTYTTLAPRIRPLEKESVCHMPPEFVGGHLNSAKSFPSGIKDITTCKTVNEKELITTRLKDLAQKRNLVASGPPPSDCKDESDVVMNNTTVEKKEDICYRVIAQLFEKVKELMACKSAQSDKIIYLERKIASMEQNLAQAQAETKNLNGICNTIEESISDSLPDDSILLIGGYDGVSWLSSLDCYSPSQNLTKSLSPMLTERCYAAVSKLDGEFFVFGGGTRGQRFNTVEKKEDISYRVIAQLFEKVKELMACKSAQSDKIIYLERKIASMEQNLAQAQAETKNLNGICNTIEESISDSLPDDSILLIGGYDGVSWLSSLDCYSPSQNLTKSLSPMLTERCYAAVSKLDGELFVFGGGTRGQRFNTVESFDPVKNRWTFCPPLNQKNENLAGATVKDRIYALGGGINGVDCYSSVEMLDFDVGAWIPTRSMLQKRFALAAAELHGALYAVGGYDGSNYLSSAERFDPRERSWKKIESMTTVRGCPSMVVLNEKLFVLGGYDGNAMASTVEIYDPRRGSWMIGEPMNHPRGFSAAAVAKDCVYIFGGLRNDQKINETVECYKEGQGWEVTNGACQKCFFSAITL
ncbi:development/cell death domain, Galactose oxidase, beta-propeller [Artemisia annua]|uniref:Development/cell death domain, Galactose oxidase, beta-propeller n=1 Tax=Artemisia annua TaxID=35608 RepID=A0A2U1PVG9_ARTAN|nr:development/cell death domain, Galactose oxidase, beta-propeller [Artemisia annua]